MFSPFRKYVAIKLKTRNGSQKIGKKQIKLEKHCEDNDATCPTSVCSPGSSIPLKNNSIIPHGGTTDYGYGDESPIDYGYGVAEPDVSTRDLYRQDTSPRRRTMENDSVLLPDEYDEVSPEFRGSANRKTPRRSSMKQGDQPRRASIQFTGEKEVSLPNTRKVIRRTSISFDDDVKVKPVARVMDLTKNPQNLWFQDDEFDQIKERCYNIVDKVEGGRLEEGRKLCIRGLEGMMEEQSKKKTNLRHQAWDSVMDEQDRQFNTRIFDDQAMASALMLSSIESRFEATRRAKQDEEEVRKYLSSTRRMCRRLSC